MFAYGMNTNIKSMKIRCPDAKLLGKATLSDYRFRFATHADVIPSKKSKVEGVLWEITDICLESLDMCEGYPFYYDRILVPVSFTDTIVESYVYVMQPGSGESMPSESYLNLVLAGYRDNNVDATQVLIALS